MSEQGDGWDSIFDLADWAKTPRFRSDDRYGTLLTLHFFQVQAWALWGWWALFLFPGFFSRVTDLILGHVVLGRWAAAQTVSGWRWGRLGWLGKCSASSGKLWLLTELGFPRAKTGRASEIHTLQKGESAWVICLLGLFSPKTFFPPISFYDTWWKCLMYPIAVGPGSEMHLNSKWSLSHLHVCPLGTSVLPTNCKICIV